jgi:MoaA/NifB/PqqE/SkfB family radical SAM enzyme
VAEQISSECGALIETVRDDATSFLEQVERELRPDVFNLVEQRQYQVPMGVELQLNETCNLRCAHCFQDNYRTSATMPADRALAIIDELGAKKVFEVSLIGGEPLLYQDLELVIERCRHWGLSVSLTTNATLVTEAIAEMFQRLQVRTYVSLDGVGTIHDLIRGEGNFARTEAAIGLLQNHDVTVDVLFTLNALNMDHYEQMIDYCDTHRLSCNFNLFKPFKPEHQHLVVPPDRFFKICRDLHKRRRDGQGIGFSNAAIAALLMGQEPRQECTATLAGLVIDPCGRMLSCPGLVSCGHINEDDLPMFDENWLDTWHNHPVFTQFRDNGLTGCQVRSCIFCGDPKTPDPYSAAALRQYLE